MLSYVAIVQSGTSVRLVHRRVIHGRAGAGKSECCGLSSTGEGTKGTAIALPAGTCREGPGLTILKAVSAVACHSSRWGPFFEGPAARVPFLVGTGALPGGTGRSASSKPVISNPDALQTKIARVISAAARRSSVKSEGASAAPYANSQTSHFPRYRRTDGKLIAPRPHQSWWGGFLGPVQLPPIPASLQFDPCSADIIPCFTA